MFLTMATAKKKPAPKKSIPAKAKAAVKPAPKKATPKKTAAAKVNTKTTSIPSGREAKLAEQALKLVDEAASVLRTGIRSGAETTAKSRIAAKKKANALLGKASTNLSKAIGDSASALQNLLGKI
jgi:1,4-alpha-glucan branching enzyme